MICLDQAEQKVLATAAELLATGLCTLCLATEP